MLHGYSCLCLQLQGGFQCMHYCMMQYVQFVHLTELWGAAADYKALQPHQPSEVVRVCRFFAIGPPPTTTQVRCAFLAVCSMMQVGWVCWSI
jgi:hypothetical protein